MPALIPEILAKPVFAITLTVIAYRAGWLLYRHSGRHAFLHPILVGALLVATVIFLTGTPYRDYFDASALLHFLLGPATVALAIPLWQQFQLIRRQTIAILTCLFGGAVFASGSAVLIAWLGGADGEVLLSLAPKSVTTPIAIGISEKIGGIATLSAGLVVTTGIIGAIFAPWVFRLGKIRDARAQGFALGLSSHGVGTAKAFEQGEVCGAFSSLALGLTGALTAIGLPLILVLAN